MEEESGVIPPLYGTAIFKGTPREAPEMLMSTRAVVTGEGEVDFIAAAQQWWNDAQFPRTPPDPAVCGFRGLVVMEATGEASTPQMARLSSFIAILSVTLRATGAWRMITPAAAEMEGMVPDYMLPKPASLY